jgi:EF-hand domain pair
MEAEEKRKTSDKILQIFEDFDLNHDGEISTEELRIGLEKQLQLTISDEALKKLMASFDVSGDGNLQIDEFKPIEAFKTKLEYLAREEKEATMKAEADAKEAQRQAKVLEETAAELSALLNDRPPTTSDRLVSLLPYFLPLIDSLQYGKYLLEVLGDDNVIAKFLVVLYRVYEGIPFR